MRTIAPPFPAPRLWCTQYNNNIKRNTTVLCTRMTINTRRMLQLAAYTSGFQRSPSNSRNAYLQFWTLTFLKRIILYYLNGAVDRFTNILCA